MRHRRSNWIKAEIWGKATLSGRFRRTPFQANPEELKAKGIRFPFPGRGVADLRYTEGTTSVQKAREDGKLLAEKYKAQDRMGNHAEVVAIVEWVDDELSDIDTQWSAVVNTYHSDS